MLTSIQLEQRRRRLPPPSLKQQYQEYILQRIEAFKNSLSRAELLRIGGEAAEELCSSSAGQFVLSEVLMLDTVDRMIRQRLALPSFRRWCKLFRALRVAQREPTHWGIDARSPVVSLLPRIEPGDAAAVIGSGAEGFAYLLSAHEMDVTFLASDFALVDRVETRAAEESLATSFTAFVASPGHGLPGFDRLVDLVILDTRVLEEFGTPGNREVIEELQRRTRPGGIHVLVPGGAALSPDAFVGLYPQWNLEESRGRRRGAGQPTQGLTFVLRSQTDTVPDVSLGHGDVRHNAL